MIKKGAKNTLKKDTYGKPGKNGASKSTSPSTEQRKQGAIVRQTEQGTRGKGKNDPKYG